MNATKRIQNAIPDKKGMAIKKANKPTIARITEIQNTMPFGALNIF